MKNAKKEVTLLLKESAEGEPKAMEALASAVYDECYKIAQAYMRRERSAHTLQPTALVNEAFLKLFGGAPIQWEGRRHFYRTAAVIMRRILIDHAKKRNADKRGGGLDVEPFDEARHQRDDVPGADLIALDEALEKLAKLDPRLGEVVELRYFGGLDIEQTAKVMEVSTGTVKRDWNKAKAWLLREMTRDE